jgi:4-hydroxy-tetrahydrodipicolinate reductase
MFGAAGRMGRMILSLAAAEPELYEIVGAVEYAGHPLAGHPLAEIIPGAPAGVTLEAAPPAAPPAGTVAIHFSSPEATLQHLDWSVRNNVATLIGTTGMSAEQRAAMDAIGDRVGLLITSNTSKGVNVLFWLTEQAARLLGPDYDIEIIEMHHHHKKDAPSGTARTLAEAALRARGGDLARDLRHGRQGQVGERTPGEIGMHAVRGGDVVGDHTVMLAGPGERLELIHRAGSREVLAHGAIEAAAWMSGRPAGRYTMNDVLGL